MDAETGLAIARSYLLDELDVPQNVVRLYLPDTRYRSIFFRQMTKSNVISINKKNLDTKSGETHIYISHECADMFFSPEDIESYLKDGNTREHSVNFRFFEENISSMFSRRDKDSDNDDKLQKADLRNDHSLKNTSEGKSVVWLSTHGVDTQVQLSKYSADDDNFYDFRLGIQIGDWLGFFRKDENTEITAVSVPSEFVTDYLFTVKKKTENSISEDAVYNWHVNNDDLPSACTNDLPQPVRDSEIINDTEHFKMNPAYGKGALETAHYTCEACGIKQTFKVRKTGKQYMEVQHLIPNYLQNKFSVDLDVNANLVCMCQTCREKLLYAVDEEAEPILRKIYISHEKRLEDSGLAIDYDDLRKIYNLI